MVQRMVFVKGIISAACESKRGRLALAHFLLNESSTTCSFEALYVDLGSDLSP